MPLTEIPQSLRVEFPQPRAVLRLASEGLPGVEEVVDGDGFVAVWAEPSEADAGAGLVAVHGGFGVVLATEPIGDHDRPFHPGDWPDLLVSRSLAAYAERFDLASVIAVAARSTSYATTIRRVRWPTSAGVC